MVKRDDAHYMVKYYQFFDAQCCVKQRSVLIHCNILSILSGLVELEVYVSTSKLR